MFFIVIMIKFFDFTCEKVHNVQIDSRLKSLISVSQASIKKAETQAGIYLDIMHFLAGKTKEFYHNYKEEHLD